MVTTGEALEKITTGIFWMMEYLEGFIDAGFKDDEELEEFKDFCETFRKEDLKD